MEGNEKAPGKLACETLGIPEVLAVILSYNDQRDASRCMRVCRGWYDTAMRAAWTEVIGLMPIFNALAPLERRYLNYDSNYYEPPDGPDGLLDFSVRVTFEDWIRTASYFDCIQSLILDDMRVVDDFDDRCMLEMVASRPNKNVFPNLKRLVVDCESLGCPLMMMVPIFFHETTSHLDIFLPWMGLRDSGFTSFLRHITHRSPRISHVSFKLNRVRYDSVSIHNTIHMFKQAHQFSAPWILLTPELMPSFAKLDVLEEIRGVDIGVGGPDVRLPSRPKQAGFDFTPRVGSHTFAKLAHLELFDINGTSRNLFSSGHTFPSLHTLCISSPLEENATSCLQVLYVACPILRKLHISWRGSFTDRPPESWMGPVDFRILSNLTRLRNLEEFRLLDNYPVMINDEELIQLVSGCPRLRTLHLNPDPFNPSATTVTLRVIGLLSVHCPWLEDLALYLDSENSTVDEILDVTTGTSFKHLVKLSFGASPTSALRANNILSYLGHLLSPQCKIVPSAFISPSQVSPNPTSVEYRQMWEYIASLRRNRYKSITEGR